MKLLHLVSEQVLQNLIPVLAYRPEKVVQIASAYKPIQRSAENLVRAAKHAGLENVEFATDATRSRSPGIEETREKVAMWLDREEIDYVNITGGTKQMAIGGWLAAREKAVPVIYLDGQSGEITCDPVGQVPALPKEELLESLSVQVALVAHGVENPAVIRGSSPSPTQLQFGKSGRELRHKDKHSLKRWLDEIKEEFIQRNQIKTGRPLQDSLSRPLPEAPNRTVYDYAKAASEAGFLAPENSEFYLAQPYAEPSTAASNLMALEGGWYELAVAAAMGDSEKFSGILWEVEEGISNREASALGETDVIAVDRRKPNLVFVSCKASLDSLGNQLEHLSALRARADRYGGSRSRAILCVEHADSPRQVDNLRHWAQVMRVHVKVGEEIDNLKAW